MVRIRVPSDEENVNLVDTTPGELPVVGFHAQWL